MRRKITVVGAGNVGATTAQLLAQRDYADVVSHGGTHGSPVTPLLRPSGRGGCCDA